MAQTQVKPKSGGSFQNVTGNGKATTGIVTLPPYQKQMAVFAANLIAFTQGTPSARTTYANKYADAAGVQLQYA